MPLQSRNEARAVSKASEGILRACRREVWVERNVEQLRSHKGTSVLLNAAQGSVTMLSGPSADGEGAIEVLLDCAVQNVRLVS